MRDRVSTIMTGFTLQTLFGVLHNNFFPILLFALLNWLGIYFVIKANLKLKVALPVFVIVWLSLGS